MEVFSNNQHSVLISLLISLLLKHLFDSHVLGKYIFTRRFERLNILLHSIFVKCNGIFTAYIEDYCIRCIRWFKSISFRFLIIYYVAKSLVSYLFLASISFRIRAKTLQILSLSHIAIDIFGLLNLLLVIIFKDFYELNF